METIYLKLERTDLSDDFKVSKQRIHTKCMDLIKYIKSIENVISQKFKTSDMFSLTAELSLTEHIFYTGSRFDKQITLLIEDIKTFDNLSLIDNKIKIS